MTINHTPTPWEVRTGKAAHACIYVQGTDHDVAIGMRPDDAEHIVRCVNAHDELSRELQATRAMRDAANATNTRLLAQRDELVAALESIVTQFSGDESVAADYCAKIARAAIARAKGKA